MGTLETLSDKIFRMEAGKTSTAICKILKKEVMSFVPIWYVDGLQKKAVSLAENDTPFYIDEYGLLLEKIFDSIDLVDTANGMLLSVPSWL